VLAAALATAAAVGWLTQRSDAGGRNSSVASVPRIGSAEVGGFVLQARAAGDRIWVLTCTHACGMAASGADQERLVELNSSTGAVIRSLPLADATAIAIAGRGVWVAHFLSGEVTRIDPASGRATASVRLRLPTPIVRHDRHFLPVSLSSANGYVWASTARGWLAQIAARTGRLVRMVPTPSEDNSTTTDRYGIWVAEDLDGIGLLAPHTTRLRIRTIEQAGQPLAIYSVMSGGGLVWALAAAPYASNGSSETTVAMIDPRTDRIIRRVQVPEADGAVVARGALYLGGLDHGRIYRVTRGGALQTFVTPRRRAALATASSGVIWAATSTKPGRLLSLKLPPG
jgi:outer membrane protein assembly factor BamB